MMLKTLKLTDGQPTNQAIYLAAAVVSILFSYIATTISPIVNRDGVLFLLTAQTYAENGFDQAVDLYFWPFYSIFIAWAHQLTGLDYLGAARVLNSLLIAILSVSFIGFAQQCGKQKNIGIWAAAVILLLPTVNEYRHYIIRDFGSLAFSFMGFWLLACFINTGKKVYALIAPLCLVIAALFRIETLLFIAALPFLAIFIPEYKGQRLRAFLLLSITPAIFAVAITAVILNQEAINLTSLYAGTSEYIERRSIGVLESFPLAAEEFGNTVLKGYASGYTRTGLLGSLIFILAASIFDLLSPLFLLLLIMKRREINKLPKKGRLIIFYFLFIAVTTPLIFILSTQILAGRYSLLAALLLCILVTHIAATMHEELKSSITKSRKAIAIITVTGLILLADGFISTAGSKNEITDSIQWIKNNTPKTASLFSNEIKIAYHSERNFEYNTIRRQGLISRGKPIEADYWAIRSKDDDQNTRSQIEKNYGYLAPIKEFSNEDGNRVTIYKNTKND